jgi:mRNA interferase MazF
MGMKRGDLVTVSLSGDYGKPRPALIIQSDFFDEHPSVTILPITSDLRETPLFRIIIEPSETNGLRKQSQVMVDKAHTVVREKLSAPFGKIDESLMLTINRTLALFLGFA